MSDFPGRRSRYALPAVEFTSSGRSASSGVTMRQMSLRAFGRQMRLAMAFRSAFVPTLLALPLHAQEVLVLPPGETAHELGWAIAADHDRVLAGAPGSNAAHVFERASAEWVWAARLESAWTVGDERFGCSVALAEDLALVGALAASDAGPASGAAYVFQRTCSGWIERARLLAPDAAAGHAFGESVALDAERAFVGAYRADGAAAGSGAVYLFQRHGDAWRFEKKLFAAAGAREDRFGKSIALDGDRLLVTAFFAEQSGAAYLYERDAGEWRETERLLPVGVAAGDFYGISCALRGKFALVGADGDDLTGLDAGAVHLFEQAGRSWQPIATLRPPIASSHAWFGFSVALDTTRILAGAPFAGDEDPSGSAWLFRTSDAAPGRSTRLDDPAGEQIGWSVALTTNCALAGAPATPAIHGSGAVHVFQLRPSTPAPTPPPPPGGWR